MPNSCSAPRCQTGYYNDHSGVPIFKMPSTQESIDIWKCFIHREGKLSFALKHLHLLVLHLLGPLQLHLVKPCPPEAD